MVDTIDLTEDPVLVRVVGAVDAEVDGERIVLSPRDYSYFALAGVGGAVWDLIDGHRSLSEVVDSLATRFAAPEGAIRAETEQFIQSLAAAGLVRGE